LTGISIKKLSIPIVLFLNQNLMTFLEIIHPRETRKLPKQRLQDACTLFTQDAPLLNGQYTLTSRVSLQDFRAFVAALEKNFTGLLHLCDEFGFEDLSVRLSDFLRSGDRELRRRVLLLEEGAIVRERQIERLEQEVAKLSCLPRSGDP
jgi:hypothetical protein